MSLSTYTAANKRIFDPEILLSSNVPPSSNIRLFVQAKPENVASKQFRGIGASSTHTANSTNIVPILCNVIASLKNQIEYNGYYISFLLDQISEEEFAEIAKSFAIEFKSILSHSDIYKIKTLKDYLGDILSNTDISNITKIEESKIDELLK